MNTGDIKWFMEELERQMEQLAGLIRNVSEKMAQIASEIEKTPQDAIDTAVRGPRLLEIATELELGNLKLARRTEDIKIICTLLRKNADETMRLLPLVLEEEVKNEIN